MFLKKFIVINCQSLTRTVFTTPRAYGKLNVGIRATTDRKINRAILLSPTAVTYTKQMNWALMLGGHTWAKWPDVVRNQMNQVIVLGGHCAKSHDVVTKEMNRVIVSARCPLRQMTQCGRKPNEPSHCARWPLRQMSQCGHKPNEPSDHVVQKSPSIVTNIKLLSTGLYNSFLIHNFVLAWLCLIEWTL